MIEINSAAEGMSLLICCIPTNGFGAGGGKILFDRPHRLSQKIGDNQLHFTRLVDMKFDECPGIEGIGVIAEELKIFGWEGNLEVFDAGHTARWRS